MATAAITRARMTLGCRVAALVFLLACLFIASTAANKCAKCNVPLVQGGCKCDNNCDCRPGLGGSKCDKCNIAVSAGGCKCDRNCDCVGGSSGGGSGGGSSGGGSGGGGTSGGTSGCPSGWSPAVGTLYDSWPKPGTTECVQYSGCRWAGMFSQINGGSNQQCRNGAQWLNGGNGVFDCRFPESTVRSWNIAATYSSDRSPLLGKQVQVMVQGRPSRTVTVNVRDVCSDSDCNGCCRTNTGNRRWKLIDLEKWPASQLLGFDPTPRNFDINNVNKPTAVGMRPGAPESSVMPLCYRIVGNAAT